MTNTFASSRFMFYCTAPLLLVFLVLMPFLVRPQGPTGWMIFAGVEILALLVLLGLFDGQRFWWCWRAVGGIVFAIYIAYLAEMIVTGELLGDGRRSSTNAVNAAIGLCVFGLPGLWYAVLGRLTFRRESDESYANWQTATFPDVVSFRAPPDSSVSLIDDETTIVIELAPDPKTDVLFGLFPLRQAETATPHALELELRDFTSRCIAQRASVSSESYEPADDGDFVDVICYQAVINLSDDRWWIARAYAREGGNEILLVHSNGPENILTSSVLSIMVSIVPEFALTADPSGRLSENSV
jgi:hypothetical protein